MAELAAPDHKPSAGRPAAPALPAMLSGPVPATVQRLAETGRMLNASPAIVAQRALAADLSAGSAVNRTGLPEGLRMDRNPAQLKAAVAINDDAGLEAEADAMGAQAAQLAPNRAAPALATLAVAAPVAQRALTVDGQRIRRFGQQIRRQIANAAGRGRVTGGAWTYLEGLITDGVNRPDISTEDLVQELIDLDMIVARAPRNTFTGSHHTSNPMATERFSTDTNRDVEIDDGEHRRHVIGRHTLGRAAGRSTGDQDQDVADFIEEYGGTLPTPRNSISLRQEAYRMMQDHQGNLWAGEGGENSALGVATGALYNWLNNLLRADNPTAEQARDSLLSIRTFGFAQEALDQIKHLALNILETYAIQDDRFVPTGEFTELITGLGQNAEFDMPQDDMEPVYSQIAMDLFNRMVTSNNIFSDGTAAEFMDLDLNEFYREDDSEEEFEDSSSDHDENDGQNDGDLGGNGGFNLDDIFRGGGSQEMGGMEDEDLMGGGGFGGFQNFDGGNQMMGGMEDEDVFEPQQQQEFVPDFGAFNTFPNSPLEPLFPELEQHMGGGFGRNDSVDMENVDDL